MINYLLLLQFPLLYCITVVLGLVVYGSDFEQAVNWLYFLPLVVMPALWGVLIKQSSQLNKKLLSQLVLGGLALTALLAARDLHFAWWDEHSFGQAILVSIVGILSCVASLIAAIRLSVWQGNHQASRSAALLLLGLGWLPALYYPMASLLVIALIAMLSVVWSESVSGKISTGPGKPAPVIRYLAFLLMMDISLMIWDFQVDSNWSLHLMVAIIAAALSSKMLQRAGDRNISVLIVALTAVISVNYLVAIIWPSFIINPVHSVIAGAGLGVVIGLLFYSEDEHRPWQVNGLAVAVTAGMVAGNLFYANLAFAAWRGLFLLPLIIMLAQMLLRRPGGKP
jgi:hypothetical protein